MAKTATVLDAPHAFSWNFTRHDVCLTTMSNRTNRPGSGGTICLVSMNGINWLTGVVITGFITVIGTIAGAIWGVRQIVGS